MALSVLIERLVLLKVDRAESRDTVNREKYTANLDTFLLRRNTRLAFSQNTQLASIKLIEWTQLAGDVSREALG